MPFSIRMLLSRFQITNRKMINQQALSEDENISSTSIIALTFKIYGTSFLGLVILFVIIRPWYPLIFNYCNTVATFRTPLNQGHFGHINWIWTVFQCSQKDVFLHCGMDAIVIIRFLSIGLKLSMIGVLNSIFLIPVNFSACKKHVVNDLCNSLTDTVDRVGVGNVPKSSRSLLASVMAAYILFISAMFLIVKEFKWFTLQRQKVLSERRPDNYTVYVGGIPEKYQTDVALKEYFQKIFSSEDILEANVALSIPKLEGEIVRRKQLMSRLERSLSIRERKGFEPKHLIIKKKRPTLVNSIPKHTSDITLLNTKISEAIVTIKNMQVLRDQSYEALEESVSEMASSDEDMHLREVDYDETIAKVDNDPESNREKEDKAITPGDGDRHIQDTDYDETNRDNEELENNRMKERHFLKHRLIKTIQPAIRSLINNGIRIQHILFEIKSYFKETQDGDPLSGGFVSFTNLKSKMQCIQIIHHESPSKFVVQNAPLPKDIFWHNVGLSQKRLWIGSMFSMACTIVLCLSWTVIIAFISSLAEIEQLKKLLPFLERWLDVAPWLSTFLTQLKPLLLIILVSLLPIILRLFTTFEGHIARGTLLSSQFTKISIFLVS